VTLFALIRHMPTAWNAAGRLQGRVDAPLDPEAIPAWRLPPGFADFRWLSSPLDRAIATARQLGIEALEIELRLTEMDWGEWQGQTLAGLRQALGAAMAAEEAKGLDFRPPGGESPRDVQARLRLLLAEIALVARDTAAVTHKGVIRAMFALATGWDMLDKPPHRLSWSAAHCFRLDRDGHPRIDRLNIALGPQ
jgi:broad specificity phosphatase PhoE